MGKFKVGDMVRFNLEATKNQCLSEMGSLIRGGRAFVYEEIKRKTLRVELVSGNTETVWVRVLGGEYIPHGWDDDRFLLEPVQMSLF